MVGVLAKYVDAFVGGVSADLAALSGRDAASHVPDVVVEVDDLVAAVIDSDGRHTTAELEAWLDDIGPRLDPPVRVSSVQLRASGLLAGRRSWLHQPSELATLLIDADVRDASRAAGAGGPTAARAVRYYTLAMRLAHAAAALDLVPSTEEVAAIDRFRTVLLGAFDRAGLARPGRDEPVPIDRGTALRRGPGATPPRSPQHGSLAPGGATGAAATTAATAKERAAAEAELPPARPLEELLEELDGLIGLERVKADVRRLTSLLRIETLRAERQLPTLDTSHHLVFTGNPGTGKTTVARLLSEILRTLGVVSRGHLVEADRADLVAGFVGQTATKTRDVLESALGGTLLIDEAYALARGGDNDFGREAIDTIVKFMEDHRDDVAIIAAGYPAEMATLIDTNPGLQSRFTRTIVFPDYTTAELVAIFELMSDKVRYHLDASGRDALVAAIESEPRARGFGNARFVRNLFEAAVGRHALRLADIDSPTDDELTTLTADDFGVDS